jgi:hypothetical protein
MITFFSSLKLGIQSCTKCYWNEIHGRHVTQVCEITDSESELLYDWRYTANQFVLATSPLRLTTSNFILQLNTCCYSLYVPSYLTRGWVCRLHLLLVLARAVLLRPESRGTHDHILPSQIRDSPSLEGQVTIFISPRILLCRLATRHVLTRVAKRIDVDGGILENVL